MRRLTCIVVAVTIANACGGSAPSSQTTAPAQKNDAASTQTPSPTPAAPSGATPTEQAITLPATPDSVPAMGPGSFVVAVIRSGRPDEPLHVLPIARFTGTVWASTWPTPIEEGVRFPELANVPATWLGRGVPRDWTLWLGTGKTMPASLTKTHREDSACSAPIVLQLNKTLADVPAGGSSAVGLAIDTAQSLEQARAVVPSDPAWPRLLPAVKDAFRDNRPRLMNDARLSRASPQIQQALAESNLASIEITLDHLYRQVPETDPFVYYFEASQRPIKDDVTAPHVALQGWLRKDPAGQWTAVSVEGGPAWSDESGPAGAPKRVPLGVFRLPAGLFWVLQGFGYEWSWYDLAEVTPSDIRKLLTASGGGC